MADLMTQWEALTDEQRREAAQAYAEANAAQAAEIERLRAELAEAHDRARTMLKAKVTAEGLFRRILGHYPPTGEEMTQLAEVRQPKDPHADDPNWGYHPWQVGPSEIARRDPELLKLHCEQAEEGRRKHEQTCPACNPDAEERQQPGDEARHVFGPITSRRDTARGDEVYSARCSCGVLAAIWAGVLTEVEIMRQLHAKIADHAAAVPVSHHNTPETSQ